MGQGLCLMEFRRNPCNQEIIDLHGSPGFGVVWAEAWEGASEMAFVNCTHTPPNSDKKHPKTYCSLTQSNWVSVTLRDVNNDDLNSLKAEKEN